MDALYLFPALLALMIAALTALGYALQRISDTSQQFRSSSIPHQACLECGQLLDAGAKRCSACGTLSQPVAMFVDMTPHNPDDAGTPVLRRS